MAWFSRRRAITALAAVVVVGALLIAGAAISLASRRQAASPTIHTSMSGPANITATPVVHDLGVASLQLAPYVTPDSPLHVMALGFLSGEPLAVTIDDMQGHVYEHLTLQADKGGSLQDKSLALPVRLGAGAYRLIVVGSSSHRRASATFQMRNIPPTVTLGAYTAVPGQVVDFTGTGFIPGEVVMVYLGASSAPLSHTTVTSEGAVSGQLTVPKIHAGTYTLRLVGKTSQMPASVGFNVQQFMPWVVLDRYTLTPGEREGFSAHGFAPGEQVFVYLNSLHGAPVLQLKADTAGQLVMQDTWSVDGANGNNELTFVGQWSKATTTVAFTVQAAGQ